MGMTSFQRHVVYSAIFAFLNIKDKLRVKVIACIVINTTDTSFDTYTC